MYCQFGNIGLQSPKIENLIPKPSSINDLNPFQQHQNNSYNPNRNTNTNPNAQIERHQREEPQRKAQLLELQKDLEEIRKQPNHNQKRSISPFTKEEIAKIKADKELIFSTFDTLKDILANKPNTSLSDVFYLTEKAWGNSYISKAEYDQIINNSVDFIKKWMKQEKLSLSNQDNIHFAIQNFMSKTLSISETKKSKDGKYISKNIIHNPFFYDYQDYNAFEDHRNFFVTKCIATGSGQCKSLPLVYLILAERLGAKAYLSITPNHSFVKYSNNNGEIENYEPTSNWKLSNQWYIDNFRINERAIATGLYLDTLSKQQIIADNLIDLAFFYIRKIPLNKENFLSKLLMEVDKYYPKGNNEMTYHIYKSYLEGLLE